MSAAALSPAVAAAEHGRIPVLDIGPCLAGDASAAVPLARAIARTCEDTGLVRATHSVRREKPERQLPTWIRRE